MKKHACLKNLYSSWIQYLKSRHVQKLVGLWGFSILIFYFPASLCFCYMLISGANNYDMTKKHASKKETKVLFIHILTFNFHLNTHFLLCRSGFIHTNNLSYGLVILFT